MDREVLCGTGVIWELRCSLSLPGILGRFRRGNNQVEKMIYNGVVYVADLSYSDVPPSFAKRSYKKRADLKVNPF